MDRVPCEFFLVRYVPNVVRGEFINIGVILRETGVRAASGAPVLIRFTRNWSRVICFDPGADVPMLESLEAEFAALLGSGAASNTPGLIEVLEDELSNSLQVTSGRGTLAVSLPDEMELLMGMYVEVPV